MSAKQAENGLTPFAKEMVKGLAEGLAKPPFDVRNIAAAVHILLALNLESVRHGEDSNRLSALFSKLEQSLLKRAQGSAKEDRAVRKALKGLRRVTDETFLKRDAVRKGREALYLGSLFVTTAGEAQQPATTVPKFGRLVDVPFIQSFMKGVGNAFRAESRDHATGLIEWCAYLETCFKASLGHSSTYRSEMYLEIAKDLVGDAKTIASGVQVAALALHSRTRHFREEAQDLIVSAVPAWTYKNGEDIEISIALQTARDIATQDGDANRVENVDAAFRLVSDKRFQPPLKKQRYAWPT